MTYEQLKTNIDLLERRVAYLEKLIIPAVPVDMPYSPDDIVKIILHSVCQTFNVDKALVIDKSSIPTVCDARRVCYGLCKAFTTLSLKEIGRKLGNRSHSTILNGLSHHNDYLVSDPKYVRYYNKCYIMVDNALKQEI